MNKTVRFKENNKVETNLELLRSNKHIMEIKEVCIGHIAEIFLYEYYVAGNEEYKPEVAAACYRYSTLFVKSEAAENDIKFLEKALKKSMGELTIEEMQKLLSENDIPSQANSVTLALIYKAGQEAAERGLKSQAHDCFSMVYDLTYDEEVKSKLDNLSCRDWI